MTDLISTIKAENENTLNELQGLEIKAHTKQQFDKWKSCIGGKTSENMTILAQTYYYEIKILIRKSNLDIDKLTDSEIFKLVGENIVYFENGKKIK